MLCLACMTVSALLHTALHCCRVSCTATADCAPLQHCTLTAAEFSWHAFYIVDSGGQVAAGAGGVQGGVVPEYHGVSTVTDRVQ